MATTEEGWHTLEDGTKLYTKTWKVCASDSQQLAFVNANPSLALSSQRAK